MAIGLQFASPFKAQNSGTSRNDESYSEIMKLITEQLLPDYVKQQNNQEQETRNAQALQGQYSRANAISDSANAVTAAIAAALQEVMPGITKASEGSGSSQNSMRALLTQDAAAKAGNAGALAQLQQLVQYGQIQSQLEQVLGGLVKPDNALLDIFSRLLASIETSSASASSSRGVSQGVPAIDPYSQTPGGRWGSTTVFTPYGGESPYGSVGPAATQAEMDASFYDYINRERNYGQALINASAPTFNTSNASLTSNTSNTPSNIDIFSSMNFDDISAFSTLF